MKRNVYNKLLDWKNDKNHKPLLVLGVRQCGKTYIINEFIKENYKNYQTINLMEDNRLIELYKSDNTLDNKYITLKTMLDFDLEDEDSILFIDEVQLSEEFISNLKYINEKHPNVNIICAGSLLGVKLRRLNLPFPVGKVELLYMYPMSFDEFLLAASKEKYIDLIKDSYNSNKELFKGIHDELLNLYKLFLITGGMPAAVKSVFNNNNDYINNTRKIIDDIIEEYMNDMKHYIETPREELRIRNIYSSIPEQLGNTSHKFMISKINHGAKSREYMLPLDWLLASNMVINCYKIKKPELPLELYKDEATYKLYLSDVGILTSLAKISPTDILMNNLGEHKGIIAENYVANELIKNGFLLYYWSDPEVDFIERINGDIIPIEVKAADNTQSKALKLYMEKFNPKYAIKLSTKNFGYDKTSKIKSLPLYAAFCIKDTDNIKIKDILK